MKKSTMRTSLLLAFAMLSCNQSKSGTGPERPTATASAAAGPQVREIAVTGKGFEPARVEVTPGQPVVLRFTRKVAQTCADAVDLQGDPVRHMLPLDTPVELKVKAPPSGQLAFACPMKMINGAVVVVPQ